MGVRILSEFVMDIELHNHLELNFSVGAEATDVKTRRAFPRNSLKARRPCGKRQKWDTARGDRWGKLATL